MAITISSQIGKEGTLGNTKLFEYMMVGITVICSNYVIWKEMVDKYKYRITVNPNDHNEIREAITNLLDNENEAIRMGQNGKKAVEDIFNWGNKTVKLVEL